MDNAARAAIEDDKAEEGFDVPKAADLRPMGYRLTLLWFGIGVGWLIVFSNKGIRDLGANDWGDVFAGLAAPVAFLWLVLGFLQQGHELRLSTKALTLQVRELRESVEQQKELVDASRKALDASTDHTRTLISIERAYVVGGGDTFDRQSKRYFRVDVANYGKTPAFLVAFDVQFAKLEDVRAYPCTVSPNHAFDDQLPPGVVKHGIGIAQVPIGAEVAYGAFWYQGWGQERHLFRFILRLSAGRTRPDVSGVDDMYRYRD